jgi:glyoxylase-like metal-dependent hydrolase (beta-lactamase superfamily II)
MSIPFVKTFDFEYGIAEQITPRVRRVIADNPGPFTYTGTGVYIIGDKNVAVIDPGPQTPNHIAALDKALEGCTVTHVLVTHHHSDHSPMALPLARKHGCKVYGYGKQIHAPEGGEVRLEAGDDLTFNPDIDIRDGYVVNGDGWTIEAIHTPGHTSNHMCYALKEENILFSGDHIMGWSTSVVSPPDGHMGDYLNSLEHIRERNFATIWPTHGAAITEPAPFVDAYIAHRHKREAQILDVLDQGVTKITDMVKMLYADINPRLHPAAAHSVLSHLIYLCETGRVSCSGAKPSLKSEYCHCSRTKTAVA